MPTIMGPQIKLHTSGGPNPRVVMHGASRNGRRFVTGATTSSTAASASVTIVDNTFVNRRCVLHIGDCSIINGLNFTPGNSAANSAIALAQTISRIPGFSAVVDQGINTKVNISGPDGFDSDTISFYAVQSGSVTNLSLSPSTGFMTRGSPWFDAVLFQ